MADGMLAGLGAFGDALPPGRLGRLGTEPGLIARPLVWPGAAFVMTPAGEQAAADAALASLGLALPPPRRTAAAGEWHAFAVGPDRWLVIGPDGTAARLAEALGTAGRVVDQSDARAALLLRGPSVREVLARLVGIDLHPRAFAVGNVAATPAGHLPALVWQADDAPTFGLAVSRSMAGSLAHWLIETGAPFGMLIEP